VLILLWQVSFSPQRLRLVVCAGPAFGQAATVTATSFKLRLALQPGENKFVIVATDAFGNDTPPLSHCAFDAGRLSTRRTTRQVHRRDSGASRDGRDRARARSCR
jgi:hypothetical protein